MALTVSSTTDDQAAVNAAAGIAETPEVEAPEAARHPEKEAPAPKPAPTPAPAPEEEEDPGEEPAQEEEEAKAKPKGGFQRKIEKLERKLEDTERRHQELLFHIRTGVRPQDVPKVPEPPSGPPKQEQFETYEQFIDAVTDYKLEQALAKRSAIEQAQRQQEAQAQRISGWHERVGQFKTTATDFEDALDAVSHIPIPPVLQQALISSEDGPRLAYELARHPDVLEKITRLDPLAQLTALGKFEASLSTAAVQAAPPRRPPVSQAPPPIRPVGQGASNGSTVPFDQMSYQDYKRARERQIKARRTG